MRRRLIAALVCAAALAGCGGTTQHAVTQKLHAGPAACPGGYQTPYGCQAHSPTFGLPPKGAPRAVAPSSTPTEEMFDSVTVSTVPAGAQAVAGYVQGNFLTYRLLVAAFPHAAHVPIGIFSSFPLYRSVVGPMACLDVEPGDATPAFAGSWARGELGLGGHGLTGIGGVKPCIYANLSTMPQVRASLTAAGLKRSQYFLWVADWTYHPGLLAGYDADQWSNHALRRNLDESTVSLAFLGIRPGPKPVPDLGGAQHYERYPNVKWASTSSRERNTIITWDRHACMTPVRRPVCRSSRAHMQLLLGRDQAVYRRQTRGQRDLDHTPGRIQGLSHRLNNGRGVVHRWL